MIDTREIHPMTDFLRNHKSHVARLKETGKPEVLTINGKAEVVIQDADSYQQMMDRLERAELIAAVQEGMTSAERGEMKPAHQVFAEMRAEYGRQSFLEGLNADFATLRANSDEWVAEQEERKLWEQTLKDGLEEE